MLHRAWQPQADKPVAAHHGLTNALALAAAKGQVLELVRRLVGHGLVHREALRLEGVRLVPQLGGAAVQGALEACLETAQKQVEAWDAGQQGSSAGTPKGVIPAGAGAMRLGTIALSWASNGISPPVQVPGGGERWGP